MTSERRGVPADLLLPEERTETVHRTGPWSFTVRRGELDDIGFDGVPALRSIRFVVRDRDWATIPSSLRSLEVTGSGLSISGEAARADVSVPWRLHVRADAERLVVELQATSTTAFLRNRLGLIVLHPPDLAGQELVVGHPDGNSDATRFPTHVAPHQPARDIASLAWQRDGVGFGVEFSGDVFEMEDQRNWTDASFKTYSTPLSIPFPVRLEAGDSVQQSVTVRASRATLRTGRAGAPESTLAVSGTAAGRMPEIVRIAPTAPDAAVSLTPHHGAVLVELDLRMPGWRAMLARACEQQAAVLDLRIVADDIGEVGDVLDALPHEGSLTLGRIAVFDPRSHATDPHMLPLVAEQLRLRHRDASVIAGTRAHFTELNRHHGRLKDWSGPLTFSITPFMHDVSGHQLVESLPMQRVVVESARRIAEGRPLHIGPITLGARFNAVATSAFAPTGTASVQQGFGPEFVPGATEPRQHAPSLGAWVVGSLAALATEGVASLAYFETSGPRGTVVEGRRTPADVVLGWAGELRGAPLLDVSAPGVHAVGARQADRDVILVGNLTGDPVSLRVGPHASVSSTDGVEQDAFRLDLPSGAAARVTLPRT